MVAITFPDRDALKRALGFLAGRFSGRALKSGEVIVPEEALPALAFENFKFTVIGKATYEQMAPIRSHRTAAVQRRRKGA